MFLVQAYVDLLVQEINATASFNERPLRSLYFGGGTPSLISPRQLEQIVRALDRRFSIAAGAAYIAIYQSAKWLRARPRLCGM